MAEDVSVVFGAQVGAALAGISQVATGIEELGATARSITGVFTAVGEAFLAAFAVEKIEQFIEKMGELGEQAERTSKMLGMTTEAVTEFQFAAEQMGQSGESATGSLVRLERQMENAIRGNKTAISAFENVGVSMEDLKTKSPDQILRKLADAFEQTADGPQKTAIAMALMGRAGAQMIPLLDQGAAGLDEMAQKARDAGVVLSGPVAEGMAETGRANKEMLASLQGIAITIFQAFKPAFDVVLKSLTGFFESVTANIKAGGVWNQILGAIVATVDVIINAFLLGAAAIRTFWDISSTILSDLVTLWNGLGQIMYDVLTGNFSQIGADYSAYMDKLAADTKAGIGDMAQTWLAYVDKEQKLTANLNTNGTVSLGGGGLEGGARAEGAEKPKLKDLAATGGGSKDPFSEWQTELKQKEETELGFYKNSTQMEIEFWTTKLAKLKENSKEYNQVFDALFAAQKKGAQEQLQSELADIKVKQDANKNNYEAVIALEDQKLAILKKDYGEDSAQYKAAAAEKDKIEREHVQLVESLALSHRGVLRGIQEEDLSNQLSSLDQQVQDGQITATQKYAIERQLYDQLYALRLADLEDQRHANNLSLADKQKLDDDILKLQAKHNIDMANLTTKEASDEQKKWKSVADTISNSFDQMLTGILQGTQTFNQAIGRLLGNLIISFLEADAKRLINWIATELSMTAATESAAALRQAADREGQGAAAAEHVAGALKSIATDAGKAYASVYAWAAPTLGPFAAVPAAAAAAIVFGAEALIPSAAGGMVLDQDSLVQAHEDEMILPAYLSRGLQGIIQSNGGGAGGGSGDTFNIHTIDTQSMEQFIKRNAPALAGAVKSQQQSNIGLRPKFS